MSRPIHSVNHLKSRYNKFQILAIFCTTVTVLAVILSAISSYQLGKLSRLEQKDNATKSDSIQSSLKNELDTATQEVKALREKLSTSTNTIQSLKKKNTSLQKELQKALHPPTPSSDETENALESESVVEPSDKNVQAPITDPVEKDKSSAPAPGQSQPPVQPTEPIVQPNPAATNTEGRQTEGNTSQAE